MNKKLKNVKKVNENERHQLGNAVALAFLHIRQNDEA